MSLIERRIAWQDWMEDYKINNSSDNVIDWMRSNICDEVFDWMKQYMTKQRCDCLNEIIHNWKETCKIDNSILTIWLIEWNNTWQSENVIAWINEHVIWFALWLHLNETIYKSRMCSMVT